MDAKRLLELAATPGHIPGIYNYCDRRCARCPHQENCLQFAIDQEMEFSDEDPFASISGCLDTTADLLAEAMRAQGLDREEICEDDSGSECAVPELLNDDLVQQARKYVSDCCHPINLVQDALAAAAAGVMKKVELGIAPEKGIGKETIEGCTEALESILHYRYLIFGKLSRAVSSRGRAEEADEPFAKEDAARSAGMALQAIQRSIDGWVTIHDSLSLATTDLLEMLLLLDRLRRGVEGRFPEAVVEGEAR